VTRFDVLCRDTICAPATAPGVGAVAIVRVSGPASDAIRARVFRPRRGPQRPFVATLGTVHHPESSALLDEALSIAFPVGKSYTGEAGFELHLHGGRVQVRSALHALCAAGCRLAEPGELTLRAVLNGRLDLCAGEAVLDVVEARSEAAARAALNTLRGGLADRVNPIRTAVVSALAELEARLDYPDEDLGVVDSQALRHMLAQSSASLGSLLAAAVLGQRLSEGARVALVGAPNAGKSTLLNALAGTERALVHESPGTTRDPLEIEIEIGGVACTVVDLAGMRDLALAEPVEALGIARAETERSRADIVVFVIDPEAPPPETLVTARDGERTLRIGTKADRWRVQAPTLATQFDVVLSAKEHEGLDALRTALATLLVGDGLPHDEVLLSRARQREEVARAKAALDDARTAHVENVPDEVVAAALRTAGRALDRLLGRALDEDVLDLIFSRFCIGK